MNTAPHPPTRSLSPFFDRTNRVKVVLGPEIWNPSPAASPFELRLEVPEPAAGEPVSGFGSPDIFPVVIVSVPRTLPSSIDSRQRPPVAVVSGVVE